MFWAKLSLSWLLIISFNCLELAAENKYSAELNQKQTEKVDFRTLNKPFRMAKLNLLWTKAQIRLTEPKLKSLYSDLKIQDKEEIAHKRFKSDGNDKDGMKEAEIRKKLISIMTSYDLLEHFEDVQTKAKLQENPAFNKDSENHMNKSLFKDKKLNKLWSKAESAGFTSEELQALKEEFTHHQDKIDQYHELFNTIDQDRVDDIDNAMDKEEIDKFNDVGYDPDNTIINNPNDITRKVDNIRKKHLELRDDYDRLFRLSAQGPLTKDFVEPKVQQLWHAALQGDFKPQELESLRVELKHYEGRLLKLRHLQAEHASTKTQFDPKLLNGAVKPEGFMQMEETIKKQMRKVEKLHLDLEDRILEKHTEL